MARKVLCAMGKSSYCWRPFLTSLFLGGSILHAGEVQACSCKLESLMQVAAALSLHLCDPLAPAPPRPTYISLTRSVRVAPKEKEKTGVPGTTGRGVFLDRSVCGPQNSSPLVYQLMMHCGRVWVAKCVHQ